MLYDNRQANRGKKKKAGTKGKCGNPIYSAASLRNSIKPLQAMFELACFEKPESVTFKQRVSDNYALPAPSRQVNAGEKFLWDPAESPEPGKHLIGFPQGFYQSDIRPVRIPPLPYFKKFLSWLTQIWEQYRIELIENESQRYQQHNTIYHKLNMRPKAVRPYQGVYSEALLQALDPYAKEICLMGQNKKELLTQHWEWNRIKTGKLIKDPFIFILPKRKDYKTDVSSEIRLYLNVLPSYADRVLRFLTEHVICNPAFDTIRCMKIANHDKIMERCDNTIIYLHSDKELDAILSVITGLQKKSPQFFDDQIPPTIEPRAPGIGIGESPRTGFKLNSKLIPFAYSRDLAIKARAALEEKSAESDVFSAHTAETVKLMKTLEALPAPFGDKVKALPNIILKEIEVYYSQHFQEEFTKWKEMTASASHQFENNQVILGQGFSFLELRSIIISEAMIDTLHLDANAFVCETWRKFEESQLNFFEPSKNLNP